MTLSLANSVEDVEPGCSGCNTHSDSESESSNKFRFSDFKDVKLMTGHPAANIAFTNSPYATIGDTFNIRIGTANIDGQEFKNITSFNNQIPCENNVATVTYQPSAAATGCAKPSIGFEFCQPIRDHYKLSIFLLSTVVVLCLITLPIIINSAKKHSDGPATPETTTLSSPSAPTQKHHMLKRGLWGARSPSNLLQPLHHPLAVLTITETGTATCRDLSICFMDMQNLQNSHVGYEHLPDIRYNFVVGGDGNVYEGRGWLVQNEHMDNSVEVAFMGEFSEQPPGEFMALTVPWLIDQGVKGGYLRNDVKVQCANRTGGFLCGEVRLWTRKVSGGGDRVSHQ